LRQTAERRHFHLGKRCNGPGREADQRRHSQTPDTTRWRYGDGIQFHVRREYRQRERETRPPPRGPRMPPRTLYCIYRIRATTRPPAITPSYHLHLTTRYPVPTCAAPRLARGKTQGCRAVDAAECVQGMTRLYVVPDGVGRISLGAIRAEIDSMCRSLHQAYPFSFAPQRPDTVYLRRK
jgi:hypothetical protein